MPPDGPILRLQLADAEEVTRLADRRHARRYQELSAPLTISGCGLAGKPQYVYTWLALGANVLICRRPRETTQEPKVLG